MDFNRLKEAATVLNNKFGLNPKIKLGGVTEQGLIDQITEAIEDGIWKYYEKEFPGEDITEELVKDDAILLGEETVSVLKEMKIWPGSEGEKEEPLIELEETEIVVEHFENEEGVVLEGEDDDDVYEIPDFAGLLKTVKSSAKLSLTERTSLLKKLIKDNLRVFTPTIKEMITGRFSVDDLKEEMIEALEKAIAKNKPREEEEEGKLKKIIKGVEKEKISTIAEKIDKKRRIPATKKEKYSRIDAICESLKEGPKTIQEWYERVDELMRGRDLKENKTENVFLIRIVRKMEKHFNFGVKMPKV